MKFAITGTGTIAHRFARAVRCIPGSEVWAVLSRDRARAEAFAAETGAKCTYCDIEEMMDDPNIDAVYIGTPNHMHLPQTLSALRHKKPVLCEKPAFMCERDALTAINVARQTDTLLMEAMWTRTMPAYARAKQWIAEGRIGAPRTINASFCFHSEFDPASRLYNPDMGGGALLDVGVYTLAFAMGIAGRAPDEVKGMLHICPSGVDDYNSMLLRFGDINATLTSGISVRQPDDALICGDRGMICMPRFWAARRCELRDNSGRVLDSFEEDMAEDLYHEALHFIDCCERGLKESPLMPLAETLELARIYDLLRADGMR